jgi:hypothetical protein
MNLTVKEMKEAFDHLEQFSSIMEKRDPNAERSSQVRRAIVGIQLAADSCIKRRRRLVFNFLLTSSSRRLVRCHQQVVLLLSIKISYILRLCSACDGGNIKIYLWLNSCMNVL